MVPRKLDVGCIFTNAALPLIFYIHRIQERLLGHYHDPISQGIILSGSNLHVKHDY